MSQHDYVIDNSDGLTVRNDINSVLGAIQSTNSGATAPTATTPYMFWADTNLELQNQRNAADTAWITQAVLTHAGISTDGSLVTDGLFHFVSGSAGLVTANTVANLGVFESAFDGGISILTPADRIGFLLFGSPTLNTRGLVSYDHNIDILNIASGNFDQIHVSISAGVILNEGGFATMDLRVESDLNTHMFFVDAGNNSVHIDNSLLTGAGDGDLVMANGKVIRWINQAGTSSASFLIAGNSNNDLIFEVPSAGKVFAFIFGSVVKGNFVQENSGLGLLFTGESSADHTTPATNNLVLFTKDVAGETRLFYKNTTATREIATV